MKNFLEVLIAVVALLISSSAMYGQASAPSEEITLQVVRSIIAADRQGVVAQTLQLSDAEAQAFWPLYHQYRAEMDQVTDELVKLMKEYAQYYPNVPDDRAKKILKDLTSLEQEHLDKRTSFLKKFGKVLTPAKNFRFAQVENRLDLAVQLKLAAHVPLMPLKLEKP